MLPQLLNLCVTATTVALDGGMGMGWEVDELATARPGPVGRRDAVRRARSRATHHEGTPRRQSRTHASSTSRTPRNRRHRRLDAGQRTHVTVRALHGKLAIGPGVQIGGAVLTAGAGYFLPARGIDIRRGPALAAGVWTNGWRGFKLWRGY